jgi:hypothetical protein
MVVERVEMPGTMRVYFVGKEYEKPRRTRRKYIKISAISASSAVKFFLRERLWRQAPNFDRRDRPAKEEKLWEIHLLYRECVLITTLAAVVTCRNVYRNQVLVTLNVCLKTIGQVAVTMKQSVVAATIRASKGHGALSAGAGSAKFQHFVKRSF